jgi:hypothetical protein
MTITYNMVFKISYGTKSFNIDVTQLLVTSNKSHVLYIPSGDITRCSLFRVDPTYNELKTIFIEDSNSNVTEYDENYEIYIDTTNDVVYTHETVPANLAEESEDNLIISPIRTLYGCFHDNRNILVSHLNEVKGDNLEISYIIKSAKTSTSPLDISVFSNSSNLMKYSYCDYVTCPQLLNNYSQVDALKWKDLDKSAVNYILRANFSISCVQQINVIDEIQKHASEVIANNIPDETHIELWVKRTNLVSTNGMKIVKYSKVNGSFAQTN